MKTFPFVVDAYSVYIVSRTPPESLNVDGHNTTFQWVFCNIWGPQTTATQWPQIIPTYNAC